MLKLKDHIEGFLINKNNCSVKSFTEHINQWMSLFNYPSFTMSEVIHELRFLDTVILINENENLYVYLKKKEFKF